MNGKLQAVIWDVDGTMADTEQHGHRVAFNEAFRRFGIPVHWDEATYRALLAARSGGKERMRYDFERRGLAVDQATIEALHREKTRIFVEQLRKGRIPLRAGVRRLVQEIATAGIAQAIATTMQKEALDALLAGFFGEAAERLFSVRIAGEMVARKKPAPDVYLTALAALGVAADRAVAIEDSAHGLAAARAAGLACIVVVNEETKDQDFSEACLVVESLDARQALHNPLRIPLANGICLTVLEEIRCRC